MDIRRLLSQGTENASSKNLTVNEDATFRRLRQTPFEQLRGYLFNKSWPREQREQYLESHGWTWEEYCYRLAQSWGETEFREQRDD